MKATARSIPLSGWARPAPWAWVLATGLTVGTADLLFAMAWWAPLGASPTRILQSIAAWMMGREAALAGGATTAMFGAALYLYLMCAIAAVYHVAARDHAVLRTRPLVAGAIYGALWFVLVHLLLVPMFSLAPPKRFPLDWNLACLLAHMVLIGIPCALASRRWYGTERLG